MLREWQLANPSAAEGMRVDIGYEREVSSTG